MPLWHDIQDPASPELDALAARYGLHPLHIEDCRHRNQAAKVEDGEGYLFVVLKPVEWIDDELENADLDIFIGRDFVVTVEEGGCPGTRKMVEQLKARIGDARTDQLLYRIVDAVVDQYLPVLDRFDDRIDSLEEEVLQRATPEALARIFETRRGLATMRRILANTRDVTGLLQRHPSDLLQPDMWPYWRDVYDHAARSLDMVEIQRDLISSALDVYLSSVANRTNQVMKVLTFVSTAGLPVLIISGLYGMNIHGLPFAESAAAFWVLLGLMALGIGAMFLLLRWMSRI